MKIEAGKFYKTREGRRAYISGVVAVNPFDDERPWVYPVAGYVNGCVNILSWTDEGFFYLDKEISHLDLIAEWEEQPANPLEPLNTKEQYEAIVKLGENTFAQHIAHSVEDAEVFLQPHRERGLATRIIKITEFREIVSTEF